MTQMTQITEGTAINMLRELVSYDVKIKHLSEKFDVTPSFMSMVLSGKRGPTMVMLTAIGVKKITTYVLDEDSVPS